MVSLLLQVNASHAWRSLRAWNRGSPKRGFSGDRSSAARLVALVSDEALEDTVPTLPALRVDVAPPRATELGQLEPGFVQFQDGKPGPGGGRGQPYRREVG